MTYHNTFFRTTNFDYKAGTFTAEASELFSGAGYAVSFCIENPATMTCVWYDLDKIERDREGDITLWTYKPSCSYNGYGQDVALSEKVKKTKVIVFND